MALAAGPACGTNDAGARTTTATATTGMMTLETYHFGNPGHEGVHVVDGVNSSGRQHELAGDASSFPNRRGLSALAAAGTRVIPLSREATSIGFDTGAEDLRVPYFQGDRRGADERSCPDDRELSPTGVWLPVDRRPRRSPPMTAMEGGLRELLVRHALLLLEADGEIPSLRAVARSAGVSAMTPYSYFDGKAALMGAVADRGFDALVEALEIAGRKANLVDALVAQGVAYVRFAIDNAALFRLLCSREYDHGRSGAVGRTEAVLRERVAEIIPSSVTAATFACRSLLQGMATIVLDGGKGRIDLHGVEDSIRLLVDGYVAVEGGQTVGDVTGRASALAPDRP